MWGQLKERLKKLFIDLEQLLILTTETLRRLGLIEQQELINEFMHYKMYFHQRFTWRKTMLIWKNLGNNLIASCLMILKYSMSFKLVTTSIQSYQQAIENTLIIYQHLCWLVSIKYLWEIQIISSIIRWLIYLIRIIKNRMEQKKMKNKNRKFILLLLLNL